MKSAAACAESGEKTAARLEEAGIRDQGIKYLERQARGRGTVTIRQRRESA